MQVLREGKYWSEFDAYHAGRQMAEVARERYVVSDEIGEAIAGAVRGFLLGGANSVSLVDYGRGLRVTWPGAVTFEVKITQRENGKGK